MSSILITGGAGFIGSHFILDWIDLEEGIIVNLDKLTYAGNLENLFSLEGNARHLFIRGDINDAKLLTKLLIDYQPRAIIHFAAESHVDRSIHAPEEFIQTNIVGTFTLLEMARAYWNNLDDLSKKIFRFVHISTDEVYGSLALQDPACTEIKRYEPNSPYSASKAASNHLVRSYYQTYGLPVLTTISSNNYGPYQFPEKLIPLIIFNALNSKSLPVYGDGEQIRDWLYVKDHVAAIRLILRAGQIGETYNIGGGSEQRNIDIVRTLCSILDELVPRTDKKSYTHQITYVSDRLGHDRRYAINANKIQHELGWEPSESFKSGIRKTVQWYLDNQTWVKNIASETYQARMKAEYPDIF